MHLSFCQFVFLFVDLIIVNAEYSVYNNVTKSSSKLERLKRSPEDTYLNTVEALIKIKKKKYIHLQWKRTEKQTLANGNLPVWIVNKYNDELQTIEQERFDVKEAIGDFVTYHDVDKSSAVVFFTKTRTFYGVIDTRYYIDGLPLALIRQVHKVGGKYVKKRNKPSHETPVYVPPSQAVIDSFLNRDSASSKNYHADKSINKIKRDITSKQYNNVSNIRERRESPLNEYYIETLVFVAYDITEDFLKSNPRSYLTTLVMNHITYFNAVDMIFAKLLKHDFKIHINLAGIIIENAPNIFYSITKCGQLDYFKSKQLTITNSIYNELQLYLRHEHFPFVFDSFDIIFLMTRRRLINNNEEIEAITYRRSCMYKMRMNYNFFGGIRMVIMRFNYHYDRYCIAAHEIGHTLELDHDLVHSGITVRGSQCYAIMQKSSPICLMCSDWSQKSIKQLRRFLYAHLNRCFLLNYPRSLLYQNEVRIMLWPTRQCNCYGYTYNTRRSNDIDLHPIPFNRCAEPLQCPKINYNDHLNYVSTILPLDGTPCGIESVCWNKKCVKMG